MSKLVKADQFFNFASKQVDCPQNEFTYTSLLIREINFKGDKSDNHLN